MTIFRPKLGLVLGGGGARGGAHVGVLRVLSEIGFQPDVVIGTSIGGVVATMIGAGWSIGQVEYFFTRTDFAQMLYLDRTGSSLMGNERFQMELEHCFGNADLRDLSPKVAVMAADVRNHQRVLIEHGSVVRAVLATIAVPGLFPPIEWGDYLLVDGGITDNVPMQAAYQLGAKRVVAVDLGANPESGFDLEETQGFSKYFQRAFYWLLDLAHRQMAFDTLVNSTLLASDLLVHYQLAVFPPDVLIRPDMPRIGLFSVERIPDAIRAGEQAARRVKSQLEALVRNPFYRRKPYELPPYVVVPPDSTTGEG